MVEKVICNYMEGGAGKLTVPGFGTFMRKKENGTVIFVDLLRGDDGVLRELVEDYGGYSEVDAMALIDRFIFEVKNGITRHGRAMIDGFGVMTLDHRGLYQFDYSPDKIRPVKETAVQEKLFGPEEDKPKPPGRPSPATTATAMTTNAVRRPTGPVSQIHRAAPKKFKPSQSDTFIIVAIAAAAIAILAMVFGLSTGNMPFMER